MKKVKVIRSDDPHELVRRSRDYPLSLVMCDGSGGYVLVARE